MRCFCDVAPFGSIFRILRNRVRFAITRAMGDEWKGWKGEWEGWWDRSGDRSRGHPSNWWQGEHDSGGWWPARSDGGGRGAEETSAVETCWEPWREAWRAAPREDAGEVSADLASPNQLVAPPGLAEGAGERGGAAAAAAASAVSPAAAHGALPLAAAAAAAGEELFDVDFFLTYQNFTGIFQQHNAALKYFRHVLESQGDPEQPRGRRLENKSPEEVATVLHGVRTNYAFDFTQMKPWSWQEMIAQLVPDDILWVVQGPDGHSSGLLGCAVTPRPNSYDVKRHYRARIEEGQKHQTTQLSVWDFEVFRSDGTSVRLHPSWTNRKVEVWSSDPHGAFVHPPWEGIGRSAGRGTFRHYAQLHRLRELRFDHTKDWRPPAEIRGMGGGKGKRQGQGGGP